jgi:hypothetical protein
MSKTAPLLYICVSTVRPSAHESRRFVVGSEEREEGAEEEEDQQ